MFPQVGFCAKYDGMSTINLGDIASNFGVGVHFYLGDTSIVPLKKAEVSFVYIPRISVNYIGGAYPQIRAELYKYDSVATPGQLLQNDRIAESQWVEITNSTNQPVLFHMLNSKTEKDSSGDSNYAPVPITNEELNAVSQKYVLIIRIQDTTFATGNYINFPVYNPNPGSPDPTSVTIDDYSANTSNSLTFDVCEYVQFNGVNPSGINNTFTLLPAGGPLTAVIPDIHIITNDILTTATMPTLPEYITEGKVTNVARQLLALILNNDAKIEIEGFTLGSSGFCGSAPYKPMVIDQDKNDLNVRIYPDDYTTDFNYILPVTSISYPQDGVLLVQCVLHSNMYNSVMGEIGIVARLVSLNSVVLPISSPTLPAEGERFLFGICNMPLYMKNLQSSGKFNIVFNF